MLCDWILYGKDVKIMPATTMQVNLLTMTPDAEALIYAACKQCTGADDAADVYKRLTIDPVTSADHVNELIRRVIDSGHTSVVEHVSFSFAISGISRACSHQLVRHRHQSPSQQSQRYVKADHFGFEYVLPPSIKNCKETAQVDWAGGYTMQEDAMRFFAMAMDNARNAYDNLLRLGIPAEDARFVLPNACATKIVVTMNCRALLHFFEERCCASAQWEIRALAKSMLNICKDKLPVVFEKAGPKCVRQGYCNEGKKGCGRFPKREVNND